MGGTPNMAKVELRGCPEIGHPAAAPIPFQPFCFTNIPFSWSFGRLEDRMLVVHPAKMEFWDSL